MGVRVVPDGAFGDGEGGRGARRGGNWQLGREALSSSHTCLPLSRSVCIGSRTWTTGRNTGVCPVPCFTDDTSDVSVPSTPPVNSVLTLSPWKQWQIPQVKVWSYETASLPPSLQMPIASPGCHLCF